MNKEVLKQLSDQLQRERRALIEEVSDNNQALRAISEAREPEIEEKAQQQRDSRALERLDQRQQGRLRDIDEALARIEARGHDVPGGAAFAIARHIGGG